MKKGYKIALVIIVLLLCVFGALLGFKYYKDKNKREPIKVNILDTIEGYGYTVDDRDSEYFKKEFDILKEILSADKIDDKLYSEQVAKMFVIDLYSLKNKVNKYDVGGAQYYHTGKRTMHEDKVKNTIYDYLEDDTYGDRKQDLPIVSNVEILSVDEGTYNLGENEVAAYIIKLSWEYEEDMGYDKEATIIVVKDGIKQSVVAIKNNQKEEDEN